MLQYFIDQAFCLQYNNFLNSVTIRQYNLSNKHYEHAIHDTKSSRE